jgi:cytochrome oxidase Cu insertion factor (SCO1/SenC/PrrC family)
MLVLAILVSAWPVATAYAQSARPSPQQNNLTQAAKKYYFCPMHSDVKSTKGGKCPKCGMALRLAKDDLTLASFTDASVTANNGMAEDMTPKSPAAEHLTDAAHSPGVRDGQAAMIKMNIPDIEVLDQDGNRLRFYSDLIKGKTVAINFIFTTCTTICPPLAATFARVQKQMGDKVGRDIHFISISVDPLTDTPQRLKTWGGKFKAGAGWTFVTGDKEGMDKLLNALGASVSRKEDHSPTVIIGNDLTGEWTRTYGLAPPSQMVALIQKVMEGRTTESLTKESNQR